MGIRTCRFRENLSKSRIDLLAKINTKPYFILYDDRQNEGQSKLFKLDAWNMPSSTEKFERTD